MGIIKVDINQLNSMMSEAETIQSYFASKGSTFAGNSADKLTPYLAKVRVHYAQISYNINNVKKYLEEFKEELEKVENKLGEGKALQSDVNITNTVMPLGKVTLSSNAIFAMTYKNANGETVDINFDYEYDYRSFEREFYSRKEYDLTNAVVASQAAQDLNTLAFLEGMGNSVEGIYDGAMGALAKACSIFGYEEGAEKLAKHIEKDISKDVYDKLVRTAGLDSYANPYSTQTDIASMGGNIAGTVLISYLTGLGVAKAFGVGTTAARVANSLIGAGRQALTDAGTGIEIALQRGANLREALKAGELDAATGAIIGAITGNFDALARGAGNSGSLGKILGYSLASGGVSAMEPVMNEATHTAIYHYDDSKSYWNNFKSNFVSDGVLTQMAMVGVMGTLGTLSNGLRQFNPKSKGLDVTPEMQKTDLDSVEELLKANSKFANQVETNAKTFKNDILSKTSQYTDPLQRARAMYIELNQRLHFDFDDRYHTNDVRGEREAQNFNFDTINDRNTVMCVEWSKLYRELLIDAGFDPDQVKIDRQFNSKGEPNHGWVNVRLGDYTIIADSTSGFYFGPDSAVDFAKCKIGAPTEGFAILPSKYFDGSDSLETKRLARLSYRSELNSSFAESDKLLRSIDSEIGYANGTGQYWSEDIKKLNEQFKNNSALKSAFGENYELEISKEIIKNGIPSNLDGYETFIYFQTLKDNIFPIHTSNHFNNGIEHVYNPDGIVEPLTIFKSKENNTFFVYSQSYGIISANSEAQLDFFIDQLPKPPKLN